MFLPIWSTCIYVHSCICQLSYCWVKSNIFCKFLVRVYIWGIFTHVDLWNLSKYKFLNEDKNWYGLTLFLFSLSLTPGDYFLPFYMELCGCIFFFPLVWFFNYIQFTYFFQHHLYYPNNFPSLFKIPFKYVFW